MLLQIEAKAVKNASSLLWFSGHSELENGLLFRCYHARNGSGGGGGNCGGDDDVNGDDDDIKW